MSQLKAEQETTVESGTSLLDDIVQATRLRPDNQAYQVTRDGIQALMKDLVKPEFDGVKVSGELIDMMIGEIDEQISKQVNNILHHQQFQKIESAWRSLKFLVDRTDFRENIKLEIVNVSKEDLREDFEDHEDITKSGLFRTIYTAEYGQFGGTPYGAIIGNYEFGYGPQDMNLLKKVSAVSAMSHAPFVAAASPEFFGIHSWEELPKLKDLNSLMESPQYTEWNAFREREDTRYVSLTLPRFLLRLPYGQDTVSCKRFNYNETIMDQSGDYCWGNTAFTFATRLADSFARYRWCANIIGPQGGGIVEDLPIYKYRSMGEVCTKIPTEVLISERREFELAESGFIALTMRKGSNNAAFFSANSCQKGKYFGISEEGKQAELNYKLSSQRPYMMIMDRLAHYLKVIQRENIGTWREREDLEKELNRWINQYVTEMDNPGPSIRSRCPLREVSIKVSDIPGDSGWYEISVNARPHFKYMGANFTLSLVGKLEKDQQ